MQWTGCSRVLWRHWMVQITYLDIVLPWYDIPITVDNSQNGRKLSTPDWSFKCLHDAVDEQFQGCGRKIPRQIFCLHLIGTLHATTDHGELFQREGGLLFLPDGIRDVRGDLEIVVGRLKGGVAAMSKSCQNCLKLCRSHLYWIWLSFLCGGLEILTWSQFRHPCYPAYY